MKIKLIILLFFAFLTANITTNSFQGLGESRVLEDPSMLALGGSWYFSGQTNGVAVKSTSTFWRTKFSQLSSSFSFISNKFDNFDFQSNQILNYIHFQFPIGENKSLGFSLTPSTRASYHFFDKGLDDENVLFNGEILNMDLIYYGKGGITDLKISYSSLVNKNFSIGFSWDIGFGNLLKRDTLLVNNLIVTDFNEFTYNNLYIDTYESRFVFKSNSFNVNGLYSTNNFELASSLTMDYNLVIDENKNYFTNNNFYTGTEFLSNSSYEQSTGINIRNFGLGCSYKLNKNSAINFEIHRNNQRLIPSDFELFNIKKMNTTSMHFGIFKWVPSKSDFNVLNTIILRSGWYYEFSKEYYDFGMTMGIGLEYFNNSSLVNLGYKLGYRNSMLIELNNELYSEFILSFVSSDKWFK